LKSASVSPATLSFPFSLVLPVPGPFISIYILESACKYLKSKASRFVLGLPYIDKSVWVGMTIYQSILSLQIHF
jgi:hypothetical protein